MRMTETIIKLLLFLLPLAYSPGPGNMFFAANGARFGFVATIPANAGYHIATWLVAVAIGFGFSWVATELPAFLTVIKYMGGAYVLYLAWCLFRAGTIEGDATAGHASFWDGVILLALNPKAYVIMTLMFTQFIHPAESSYTFLVFVIATVFTLNNVASFTLWAYVGDRLASLFRRDKDAQRLNTFFALMLAAVAVWMVLD